MVEQVLVDREVEIQGRLLEHDPHLSQALQHPLADVHPKDADRSLALSIEPGGEREERRLPGAVQPQEHGKITGCDREGDVVQYPPLAESVPESLDREGGNWAHRRRTRWPGVKSLPATFRPSFPRKRESRGSEAWCARSWAPA